MKYFIQTFGCAANVSDSQRLASYLQARGMKPAKSIESADHIVINTCIIRESAENRVYGLVNNLSKLRPRPKIIITGCMVGMAVRDKKGTYLRKLQKAMPLVDEFLPIEEVGFDHSPIRTSETHAFVPISNGCNNFCAFCVVPYSRGREISRPYDEVLAECYHLKLEGYKKITLVGQNVNSYGADLLLGKNNVPSYRDLKKSYFNRVNRKPTTENRQPSVQPPSLPRPVFVKHLGRFRIPTLFPALLERVAQIGFEEVSFISSNPWDFSDELIDVIAHYPNISRFIHLPVQSGDNEVLKRMKRWYTREEYLHLINNLKLRIKNVAISTDIIVGFCGETEEEFQNTVQLAKQVGFYKAYVARYSDRPQTEAHKNLKDDVSPEVKKRRWKVLNSLINIKRNS